MMIWMVSARHVRERSKEILLHLDGCDHWFSAAEMAAEHSKDPEIRPATEAELALVNEWEDERGREWRPCKDCAHKLTSDPVLRQIFSEVLPAK